MLLASWVMPSVDATVRYASPAGTDANGTSKEQPGNLVTMVGKLAAGDVLYLLDGQYDLKALLKVSKSGTADNYITIAAAEGARAVYCAAVLPGQFSLAGKVGLGKGCGPGGSSVG